MFKEVLGQWGCIPRAGGGPFPRAECRQEAINYNYGSLNARF